MYIVTYNDLQVPAKIQIEANSAQQAIFLAKQRWQQANKDHDIESCTDNWQAQKKIMKQKTLKSKTYQEVIKYLEARLKASDTPYDRVAHLAEELAFVHLLNENQDVIQLGEDGETYTPIGFHYQLTTEQE